MGATRTKDRFDGFHNGALPELRQHVGGILDKAKTLLDDGSPSSQRDARTLAPMMPGVPSVESAHPSPNSADRGFFGSRPFSRANRLLEEQGAEPVDWKLP